jgi:uncharacterized protein (DUF1330 family)
MTAYAVGLYNMRQLDWTKTYREPVTALIAKRGGRYLARGSTCRWEMLEGNAPDITGLTLIEFPSMDAARAWHRDPEYQSYIRLRQAASHLDLILVDDPAIS